MTVNFANDYQGGIALNGVRELVPLGTKKDNTAIGGIETTPTLVVRGGIQFEVHSQSPLSVGGDGGGVKVKMFLHGELKKLQNQISALAAKVAALESK